MFIIIKPVSFLEMTLLEKKASLIMTDSGGVQKESYFHHKPCIILRPETEWVEIVENGSAMLECGAGNGHRAGIHGNGDVQFSGETIQHGQKPTEFLLFGNRCMPRAG